MDINFRNLKSPYMIGEIGINHNGDLQIAKKLMDATFACNWNCVKFQKRTPDICVPEDQKNVMRDTPWGRIKYIDYRYKVEFEKNEYDYIDRYCRDKPLDWTASVWDLKSLEFLACYDIPFIKIPSALLTDSRLLSASAETKKQLIISTGMSTLEEIDAAVALLDKNNCEPIIMHTNSSYPTPVDELNLKLIPFLEKRYGCIVGYSGHEQGLQPTVIAVSLGAKIIERHITLSHDNWGTDQKASLEVLAMDMLAKRIRDINSIMGTAKKEVTKSEIDIRKKLRKNI